jgi:hypothetical protein
MWIAAGHRSVCALTVATALTVGAVSVPPAAVTPRAVHVSDVMLAAASASSPAASVVNPVGLVLVPLVKAITFVELCAIVAVDIVAAPVLEPLYWFAAWAIGNGPDNPIAFIPRYLEMIAADLMTAIRYPFTGISGAAAATGSDLLLSPSAPEPSVTATQQVDPGDVALAASASPASGVWDVINSLQIQIDTLFRTAFVVVASPVVVPLALLNVALTVTTGHSSPLLDAVLDFAFKFWTKPAPPSGAVSAAAADRSAKGNRVVSSAATDSTGAPAPKTSVAASRRLHRAVPDQVGASKPLANKPNKAPVRDAAKDAPKPVTHPGERRSGQGTAHAAPASRDSR